MKNLDLENQIKEKELIKKSDVVNAITRELKHYQNFHFNGSTDENSITYKNFSLLIEELEYIIQNKL